MAQAFAGDLFAEAAIAAAAGVEGKRMAADGRRHRTWAQRLSASAVETYGICPLRFKLEREWRIPRDVPAALQYGAAMHRVLKTYYEVRVEGTCAD